MKYHELSTKGVHGVGLAARGLAAAGAGHAGMEGLALDQRVARAVGHQVLRQHHGQVFLGHGLRAAVGAVDDRNRRAPIALARDAPVAQAPGGLLLAQALFAQRMGDGIDGIAVRQALKLSELTVTPRCLSAYQSCHWW
jgi:hypothetical protein